MKQIENAIQKAFKHQRLISICLSRIDWQKRIVGYVKDVKSPDLFTLQIIDEFGQRKGIRKIDFKSVKSVETGGIYNDALEKLEKKGFKKGKTKPKYINITKKNAFYKLNGILAQKTLCTFVFQTEYSIGVVNTCSESEFSIINVSFDGSADGTSSFNIDQLTQIRHGSNHENRISFLQKIQTKKL
jgi:hypothetical protein